MVEFMRETRDIFDKERRKISFIFDDYNIFIKPKWMLNSNDNRYEVIYKEQGILKREGKIVLASFVQANQHLFKLGINNSPASMVYSEDLYFEENPDKLKEVADELFQIKGVKCEDEELQRFSDILDDEMVTLFNVKVPEKITFGKEVYFTTFVVHREHLPNRYIDFQVFPALVYPEKTDATVLLPSRYWASEWNKKKSKAKLLTNKELTRLFDKDSEKYIETIDKQILLTIDKGIKASFKRDGWMNKVMFYQYQKTTALIYCGRYEEARLILEELLSNFDISKAQEDGPTFYIIILSNLVSVFIEQGNFEEARSNIESIEKALLKHQEGKTEKSLYLVLQFRKVELDILDGDLERGIQNLRNLLKEENNNTFTANLYLYSGIYHYKKNEKAEALQYFNQAAKIAKIPNVIKKIEMYIEKISLSI
jgi:tetratricopeptide (TPR) repeat protein